MKHLLLLTPILIIIWPCMAQETATTTTKPLEPSRFWASLANNEKLEVWKRGLAIYFLFDRHSRKDMTLGELASALDNPIWMKREDVELVTVIGGPTPLRITAGNSLFRVLVFPNADIEKHNKECIGIYMSVSGKLSSKSLLAVLKDGKRDKNAVVKLKAWAMDPTWSTYCQSISH